MFSFMSQMVHARERDLMQEKVRYAACKRK